MENPFTLINNWLSYHRTTQTKVPTSFFKYFISYPLNWGWTLGSLFFIVKFLLAGVGAPIFTVAASIPFLMLVYNFITEYNTFKKNGISGFKMAILFYGASGLVLLGIIIRLFIG